MRRSIKPSEKGNTEIMSKPAKRAGKLTTIWVSKNSPRLSNGWSSGRFKRSLSWKPNDAQSCSTFQRITGTNSSAAMSSAR